jgi:hypothetical protein
MPNPMMMMPGGIPNFGTMIPHLENLHQMDEASLNSILFSLIQTFGPALTQE